MHFMYRKSFILACSAILMVMAVVTQSQTVSSLVQPNLTQSNLVNSNAITSLVTSSNSFENAIPKIDLTTTALNELKQRMTERVSRDEGDYEARLLKGVVSYQLGETQLAFNEISELSHQAPQFHLAHLLRADMLASRANTMSDINSIGLNADKETLNLRVAALRDEARMRINANLSPISGDKVPLQLLNISPTIKTSLLVDKSNHRLYVFERDSSNAPARLIKDFYISTGRKTGNKVTEGDLKTPEGVYFITSWIPDAELPEKYGVGAFPTNYPNALDRKLGKTGDGIWLHGTDRIYYSRPPLDSEGCVVLSNLDLKKIQNLITPGVTPLVIAEKIQWVSVSEWHKTRAEVLKSIESWRLDWESLNVKNYLNHYGKSFWSGRHNQDSWAQYKTRIAKQKTFQNISLSDLSLYYYPVQVKDETASRDMVLARFTQKYHSNNYNGDIDKQIYLSKESGTWRIIYEGR